MNDDPTSGLRTPAWAGALILLLALTSLPLPMSDQDERSHRPTQSARGRFIVAFELRSDGSEFVWPLDDFPPSPRTAVVLVVEEMPRVRTAGSAVRTLPARRHLQINRELLQPRRASPAQGQDEDEFVVDLREGRLRLSVVLPPGAEPDARYRTARIALYEVEAAGSRRE